MKLFELTEHIPPSIDISYTVNHVVDYYPYGKVVREFVEGEKERYLTTQHERDEETGLDYRGARYYDSDVARFLSTDPWQDKYPAWSTYNYVMGNPIILIDPTGKGPEGYERPVPDRRFFAVNSGTTQTNRGNFGTLINNLQNFGGVTARANAFIAGNQNYQGASLSNATSYSTVKVSGLRRGDQVTFFLVMADASVKNEATITINSLRERREARKYQNEAKATARNNPNSNAGATAVGVNVVRGGGNNNTVRVRILNYDTIEISGSAKYKRFPRLTDRLR